MEYFTDGILGCIVHNIWGHAKALAVDDVEFNPRLGKLQARHVGPGKIRLMTLL